MYVITNMCIFYTDLDVHKKVYIHVCAIITIVLCCLEVLARHMLFLTLLVESPYVVGLQGKLTPTLQCNQAREQIFD